LAYIVICSAESESSLMVKCTTEWCIIDTPYEYIVGTVGKEGGSEDILTDEMTENDMRRPVPYSARNLHVISLPAVHL
jgi:hypothetical protein